MNIYQENLEYILTEAAQHTQRIRYAHQKIATFMPLKLENYKTLNEEQVAFLDHFLFRFAKLQDLIGQRLFPTILLFLGEDIKQSPFIDRLHRLEQLNLIESGKDWQRLRLLRNQLAHEYTNDPEVGTEALNLIYQQSEYLIGFYERIRDYYQSLEITN